jgi:hypothetical protein
MEANIKSITVKDGIGREVPYMPQTEEEAGEAAQDYFINGSSASSSYPCPEMQETRPGETVLAELVWQMRANRDLVEAGIDKEIRWMDININLIDGLRPEALRQIWRLVKEAKAEPTHLTGESHKQLRRPEFIICAAIHYDDGIEYPHQANNIQTGLVICGRRHHNCITNSSIMLGDRYNKNLANRAAQGFMTSMDRYVNRKEAFKIALAQKQIIHKFYDDNNSDQILVSEDLY